MLLIKEYLSSKFKNDSSFPMNGDNLDDIVWFLESYGFKKAKLNRNETTYESFHNLSIRLNEPFFLIGEYANNNVWTHWIVFGNGGTISENNPLYLCRTTKEIDETERYLKNVDDLHPINHEFFDNYEKFRSDVITNLLK